MKNSLTVGQLRAAIKDLPDSLPVHTFNPMNSRIDDHDCCYVNEAVFAPKCAIGNACLLIKIGDGFSW